MNEEERKIDRLKDAINSRKGLNRRFNILDLHKHENDTPLKWDDENESEEEILEFNDVSAEPSKSYKFIKKIFFISITVFIIASGIVIFALTKGTNSISPDKIKINVLAPALIPSGEKTEIEIAISNNNESDIEIADLIVEFPKGTRDPLDLNKDLPRERISFGDITSGQTVRKNLSFVVFGEEKSDINLKMLLEYRVPGSLSIFYKEISYASIIGSAPIALDVIGLKEITSGQEVEIKVNLSSNSKETLKNMLLKVETPLGFEVISSNPAFSGDTTTWRVGDITPQTKRSFTVRGKIIGVQTDERLFKFSVGAEESVLNGQIDSIISSASHLISVTKPFLSADVLINRESGNASIFAGEPTKAVITFQNNLNVPINDLEIIAKISGLVLDKKSINSEKGFYNSQSDEIVWSKFENDNFVSVAPGTGGDVNFTFASLPPMDTNISNLKNQEILLDISLRGKRLSERDVPEEINSTIQKKVKIITNTALSAMAVRSSGSIENQGPIPPKVGQVTTYTIIWTLTNSFNDVDRARVRAVIPPYVDFTGISLPSSEKLTWNNNSRIIEWDLGSVFSHSGIKKPVRQISFQLALNPSISQLGTSPILIKDIIFEGRDTFANIALSNKAEDITTYISKDPGFKFGDDKVSE